jgi:adenosylhomocysteine nucleosidase
VRVGDAVVARELLQHDLDVSPLFPRFEVPHVGRARFETDPALSDTLAAAALHCLNHAAQRIGEAHLADFGIDSPLLHEGLVISGDRFVATAPESAALRALLPDALAVEMEGAALAQVCADFGAPFAVVRTVSDRADDSAHVDFNRFIAEVASVYTREIIGTWLDGMAPR